MGNYQSMMLNGTSPITKAEWITMAMRHLDSIMPDITIDHDSFVLGLFETHGQTKTPKQAVEYYMSRYD